MNVVHIALLTASAVLLAATSAGSSALRRRGKDLPLIGSIIGGALLVVNADCLLPAAPIWYRIAMIAVSVAGLAWYVMSVAGAETTSGPTDAEIIARDIYAGRMPARPAAPRPQLRLVSSQPAPEIVEATIVEDEPIDPTQATVATQATFAAAGPAGSCGTTGTTYVAAHISDYVDTQRTRRAHGRHVARRHSTMDPTQRFLRLAEAYSIDRGPRSLGRSTMA